MIKFVFRAHCHCQGIRSAALADRTLKHIGKLFQAAVAFSAVDDILISWLDDVKELSEWRKVHFPSSMSFPWSNMLVAPNEPRAPH
jgi:hypothetical protein